MKGHRMSRVGKTILFSATLLLALSVAELAVRTLHPISPVESYEWNSLHRPSPIAGLAYELASNQQVVFLETTHRTNSYGMRDDEPVTNDSSVIRMIAVGDSFTFGFRVAAHDSYPEQLERRLNENPPREGQRFDVLNLGVTGYSMQDSALLLKHRGLIWKPKLIVMNYFLNDPETDPTQELQWYFRSPRWWESSALLSSIAALKTKWDIHLNGRGDYFYYLHWTGGRKWQSVVRSFCEIGSEAEGRQIPVVLLIFPYVLDRPWSEHPYGDIHQQVAEAAQRCGLNSIDLLAKFSEYAPADLMVSSIDSHPSVLGHALAADSILTWLKERPILLDSWTQTTP